MLLPFNAQTAPRLVALGLVLSGHRKQLLHHGAGLDEQHLSVLVVPLLMHGQTVQLALAVSHWCSPCS